MNYTPPKWAQLLLSRFHPEDTLEEVEGDLGELYAFWVQNSGEFLADVRYWFSVLTVYPLLCVVGKKENTINHQNLEMLC